MVLLLDKEFLINKIKNLKGENINNKYFVFSIIDSRNIINVYFDNKNYNLVGWQTEDIYQNLVITYIYNIKYNKKIDNNLFKLPSRN